VAEAGLDGKVEVIFLRETYDTRGFQGVIAEIRKSHPGARLHALPGTIGGMPVTTRLAMMMEDALQAFAVRAVCFIGELGVPFSEEFDGHDYAATHVIACLGDEPVGAVRLRWFPPFALVQRPAVLPRFRGRGAGQILLERGRALAAGRGCTMLCIHVLPHDTGYWEKKGWQRLVPEATGNRWQIVLRGAAQPGRHAGRHGHELIRVICAINHGRRLGRPLFFPGLGELPGEGWLSRQRDGGADGCIRNRRRTERSASS